MRVLYVARAALIACLVTWMVCIAIALSTSWLKVGDEVWAWNCLVVGAYAAIGAVVSSIVCIGAKLAELVVKRRKKQISNG